MKLLLLCFLPGFFISPGSKQITGTKNPFISPGYSSCIISDKEDGILNFQDKQEPGKLSATVFKAQAYCRAELPADFEFDVKFKVVSATVYFSGANFRNVEKGAINSNSLKPVKEFMDRCAPGSMIVFDNVKVVGPDKKVRTIPGKSILLY
ncbi:MAG: GldM family protein [Ferruginibacter sp.]